MCLLSSVACLYRSLRNEHIWFLYLNLKVVGLCDTTFKLRYIYIYNVLLHKNITKTYKKVNPNVANSIELEAKSLSKKLQLDDRINTTARREAFITLKDHKPNFDNNPTCRLINPTKAEIGKISKRILDRINTKVVHTLQLNQWKNTKAVLN